MGPSANIDVDSITKDQPHDSSQIATGVLNKSEGFVRTPLSLFVEFVQRTNFEPSHDSRWSPYLNSSLKSRGDKKLSTSHSAAQAGKSTDPSIVYTQWIEIQ